MPASAARCWAWSMARWSRWRRRRVLVLLRRRQAQAHLPRPARCLLRRRAGTGGVRHQPPLDRAPAPAGRAGGRIQGDLLRAQPGLGDGQLRVHPPSQSLRLQPHVQPGHAADRVQPLRAAGQRRRHRRRRVDGIEGSLLRRPLRPAAAGRLRMADPPSGAHDRAGLRLPRRGAVRPRFRQRGIRRGAVRPEPRRPGPAQRATQGRVQTPAQHPAAGSFAKYQDMDFWQDQAGTAAGIVAPRRTDRQNTTDSTKDTP